MGGPESKAIAEWMVSVIEDFFYENGMNCLYYLKQKLSNNVCL